MLRQATTKRQSNLPSRLGAPNKIKSPIKAMIIPSILFKLGFSLNKNMQ